MTFFQRPDPPPGQHRALHYPPLCGATTKAGTPCKLSANKCPHHRAAERARGTRPSSWSAQ